MYRHPFDGSFGYVDVTNPMTQRWSTQRSNESTVRSFAHNGGGSSSGNSLSLVSFIILTGRSERSIQVFIKCFGVLPHERLSCELIKNITLNPEVKDK